MRTLRPLPSLLMCSPMTGTTTPKGPQRHSADVLAHSHMHVHVETHTHTWLHVSLPFAITAFTHQGAKPNASFHLEPRECVQTKTVHSKQAMMTPHCVYMYVWVGGGWLCVCLEGGVGCVHGVSHATSLRRVH